MFDAGRARNAGWRRTARAPVSRGAERQNRTAGQPRAGPSGGSGQTG